jgi:hypothetical protein
MAVGQFQIFGRSFGPEKSIACGVPVKIAGQEIHVDSGAIWAGSVGDGVWDRLEPIVNPDGSIDFDLLTRAIRYHLTELPVQDSLTKYRQKVFAGPDTMIDDA